MATITVDTRSAKVWCARITGRDEKYGLTREFIRWASRDKRTATYIVGDGIWQLADRDGQRFAGVEGDTVVPLTAEDVDRALNGWDVMADKVAAAESAAAKEAAAKAESQRALRLLADMIEEAAADPAQVAALDERRSNRHVGGVNEVLAATPASLRAGGRPKLTLLPAPGQTYQEMIRTDPSRLVAATAAAVFVSNDLLRPPDEIMAILAGRQDVGGSDA